MATEKETLQEKAEDLGLDTEGTIAQLKDSIEAAEAEETAAPSEPPPEVVAEKPVAEAAPAEALPEAPVNPVAVTPKAVPAGTVRIYDVTSSFWMMTADGSQLAQNGGSVKLTEKQAAKYLRHGNIKLAA